MRRIVATLACTVLLLGAGASSSGAQLPPAERWRTIATEHFRIHFTPGLEDNARRAAVSAERAWAQLALELAPPRGPVDLVVADNVDFSNGLATPFPSNRIVVYAHPPVSVASLRLHDDWNALVITHELAHIFHLDRSGGWWRQAQRVFGRAPILFPNAYAPGWLTEGLAIYYESRLTGVGRLVGTEHRALARASAVAEELPWLHQLSLGNSHFPGGEGAYAYGGLMLDYLARTRGSQGMRTMVDALSEQSVPFMLDRAARRGFGVGFAQAWREWRDSVGAETGPAAGVSPMNGWRELTKAGNNALHPRWLGDSAIIYSANTGRELPGAYRVGLDGRTRRIGRRNGLEPNVPLADGGLLFAQLEFDGPYRLRSDLYVQRDGRERRLTRAARLSYPDARADGSIVAVQAVPGSTRLVRVTPDGGVVTPITTTAPDTQWAEPRWSPRGDMIAAVRRRPGAIAEIVVIDTLGTVRQVVAGGRAAFATPSWSSDGARILFVADSSGRTEVYEAQAATTSTLPRERRLTSTVTAVFGPSESPDGSMLALGVLRADGQHIGVAPLGGMAVAPNRDSAATVPPDSVAMNVAEMADATTRVEATLPEEVADARPGADTAAVARRYSALRTLRPYYWLPVVQQNARDRWQFGGLTSGQDVIGRHSYFAQAHSELDGRGIDAYASYRYLGLGQPAIDLAAEHTRLDYDVADFGTWSTALSGAATATRPGTRHSSWVQAGGEVEWFRLSQDEGAVEPGDRRHLHDVRRTLFGAAGWSNARRPSFSISPEDGVSLSVTVRRRWAELDGLALGTSLEDSWTEIIGTTNLYKSLDLPGFAHHVLALRLAGGHAEDQRLSDFDVGGTSGSSLPLIAGSSIGGARRTFPVRGFPVGALRGVRAATGALEYRIPAVRGGRGVGLLPVFFDRSSVTLFGDAGSAWCAAELSSAEAGVCGPGSTSREWLASAGAEINLDAAVLAYDAIYRIRLGAAVPVRDRRELATQSVTGYATLGLSF